MISIEDALANAEAKSLDLVQVSPKGSEPVVCKLLDYGKFLVKENVSSKGLKKFSKEIKFRTTTDTGDYNIKLKRLKALLLLEIRLK